MYFPQAENPRTKKTSHKAGFKHKAQILSEGSPPLARVRFVQNEWHLGNPRNQNPKN
jgi:hypothetical protein